MTRINKSIIILFTALLFQQAASQDLNTKIIGTWSPEKDPIGYITYKADGTFEEFISKDFTRTGTWSVENNSIILIANNTPNTNTSYSVFKYEMAVIQDNVLNYSLEGVNVRFVRSEKK